MLAFLSEGLEKTHVGLTCLQPHRKVKASGRPRFMVRSTTEDQGAEAKGGPDFHISNLPLSAEVWGKAFLPLENHGGFTFLNKTEKKASTETRI